MPYRTQSRGKRRQNSRRHVSVPRSLGQLDIVPAEPDIQPHQQDSHQAATPIYAAGQGLQRVPTPHTSQDYGNVADDDLLELMCDNLPEGNDGAGTNFSRQSSPAASRAADDFMKASADYSDNNYDLPATSSPKNDNLPDTVPLPQLEHIDPEIASDVGKHSAVDLSETATTARRSPSLRPSEAQELHWMDSSSRATSKRPMKDTDHSFAGGEESPAAIFLNAHVARVKQAPDLDEDELSHQQQLRSKYPEKPRDDNEARLNTYDDSGAPPGNANSEVSNTSLKAITGKGSQLSMRSDEPLSRMPLKEITQVSARKTVHHKTSRSPVKPSAPEPSPNCANTSGKKRKQRAKDPVVFDAVTQEVKEGSSTKKRSPPVTQSAAKTVNTPAPAVKAPAAVAKEPPRVSKPPENSKKRLAPRAAHKPAKKAKTGLKQAPQPKSPKRTSHRAAAQAAKAAVRQQLDSSPHSVDRTFDGSEPAGKHRQPAVVKVAQPSSTGEGASAAQQLDTSPCSEAKARDAPVPQGHRRQAVLEQSTKPPMPAKGAESQRLSPRKGFGGASGKMYTAGSNLQTIGDSQNDTQELVQAHLAEERAMEDQIWISSDSSSEADDAQPLAPPAKLAHDVHKPKQRMKNTSCTRIKAVNAVVPEGTGTPGQGIAGIAKQAAAELRNPCEQHDHYPLKAEHRLSSRVAHVPSQAPSSLMESREHAAEPKMNSDRRRSQVNLRPDDAFIDVQPLEDRGRARTQSAWNRTLSISQQGSPTRLSNGDNEHSNPNRQAPVDGLSASSAVMKECLGHSSQRSPHPVRRRLSYYPGSIEANRPEVTTNAPQSELTGETLVDSGGTNAQASKPSTSRTGVTPADALKIRNKIYNQILMADRVEQPRHHTPEPEVVPEKISPMGARRENVHDQLQSIILTITQRLRESEQGPDDTVEAYEERTLQCIQSIHRRLHAEHEELLDEWKGHSQAFIRSVDNAKRPLRDAVTARSDGARGGEGPLVKRQRLYDQASRSLRAFHSQIMRG